MEKATPRVQEWLKKILEDRCSKNASYSLRAFARDLSMDASQLSSVLKGKKGISIDRAEKIANSAGLSREEARVFLLGVQKEHGRSRRTRAQAEKALKEEPSNKLTVHNLTADQFQLVSNLSNTSVLEYLRLPRVDQSPDVMAKVFQLSAHEVNQIIGRLERLELIEKKGKRWVPVIGALTASSTIPSEAIRNHHSQVLKKAEAALHFQGLDQREFSSTEVNVRTDQLPEMKQYLRGVWRDFCEKFADNQRGDAVYELSVQFFELGNFKKIRSKK